MLCPAFLNCLQTQNNLPTVSVEDTICSSLFGMWAHRVVQPFQDGEAHACSAVFGCIDDLSLLVQVLHPFSGTSLPAHEMTKSVLCQEKPPLRNLSTVDGFGPEKGQDSLIFVSTSRKGLQHNCGKWGM